jgi:ATP-dependent Lhr-like helicase
VISEPEGNYVGSVYEDFAFESMAGDVFLLGNTPWRIRRIEKGKVRVEDAHGSAPNVPFWQGEAPARSRELSHFVSSVREGISRLIGETAGCMEWLAKEAGLSKVAAEQAHAYILEGKRVLGIVPTASHVVAERFFDETGGMQLVIHAPFGGRINKAWGHVLRKRLGRDSDLPLQASATDDGVNLSLGPEHSFPVSDILHYLRPQKIRQAVTEAVLDSPLFITRWRWTLSRSLVLLRFAGGKRVPAPIQRMRSDDLLAAIEPKSNHDMGGTHESTIDVPDHVLIFETLRDCLEEAMDIEGLRDVLEKLDGGDIQFSAKDTSMPSVFAHQMLNAMPYAFLDDAPLQERRARAVVLRRALPENTDELGALNHEAILSAAEDAWPVVRDPDELHDALIGLILFPENELGRWDEHAGEWMDALIQSGRAVRINHHGRIYWTSIENSGFISNEIEPENSSSSSENRLVRLARGWIEVSGPVTAHDLARILGFPEKKLYEALIQLESEGLVLRGNFTEKREEEFCDRRILARIHRATIRQLRREIEPVPAAIFIGFLFKWQHVTSESQLSGESGVLEVVDQLQGFETAAGAWEDEILRPRILDYKPAYLDNLCLGGDVVWGRWRRRATQAEVPMRRPGLARNGPLGLGIREDMAWLLDETPADETALSVTSRDVLEFLRRRGASFFPEITAGTRHLAAEVEDALWQLVASGLITADSFTALRSLVSGEAKKLERSRRRRQPRRTREGRWSLLNPLAPIAEERTELWAQQFVRRYGVLCRELLARESSAPPWMELLRVLRRSEARGEIRGGRFIAGLNGEQFALPEAVDALREERRHGPPGYFFNISACDPLNLVGILTPGSRVTAVLGNRILYRDGVPVAVTENERLRILIQAEDEERRLMERLLDVRSNALGQLKTSNPH